MRSDKVRAGAARRKVPWDTIRVAWTLGTPSFVSMLEKISKRELKKRENDKALVAKFAVAKA